MLPVLLLAVVTAALIPGLPLAGHLRSQDCSCYASIPRYGCQHLKNLYMYGVLMPPDCAQTESGQGYNLDCSLFERLVKGGFPVATLEEQRRMRPSVARLIRDTIYPNLSVGAPLPPPPFSMHPPLLLLS